jgi:hypothetical protein
MRNLSTAIFLGVLTLAIVVPAQGEDNAAKKPIGIWSRSVNDQKITFDFKDDGMMVTLVINGDTIKAEGDYGITKEGRIFGILNKVTKPGNDGPNEGDLFSFKVKVNDNKLTIDDLRGTKDSSEAQQLVHGDYEKQK